MNITWQIREVLQTLLRGDLVVPKTVGADAKKVRSLIGAMWTAGLVAWDEESNECWVFKITDDGLAALSESTSCLSNIKVLVGDH
jgi:hypothetical protein